MKKVLYIYRHPDKGISIGKVFKPIEQAMKQFAQVDSIYLPCATAKPAALYRNIRYAQKAVKQHYDIVHVTGDAHYLLPFLRNVKTICTVHDLGVFTNQRFSLLSIWHYCGWIYSLKFASAVTFISEKSMREANKLVHIDSFRKSVILNPISNDFTLQKKEFNKDCPVILHIGTKPNKNLNNTILALQGVKCHLRIIGPLSDDLKLLLNLYKIDYSQAQDISDCELIEEYKKCDIVNFPSFYEGFGMPIIEGQAIGRIIVTSNLSPMNEVAGAGAVLVNPTDEKSLYAGYQKVLNNSTLREHLIDAGSKNVQRFNLSNIVSAYFNLYNQLLCD